ncbi:hypothetical protein [Streptomyces sp. NPDC001135]
MREAARVQPDLLSSTAARTPAPSRAGRAPWLAADPEGHTGDSAYDGGTLLKTYAPDRATAGGLPKAGDRALGVFAETAGPERERVRGRARLHAVQAAFSGRRQGFRRARHGAQRRLSPCWSPG